MGQETIIKSIQKLTLVILLIFSLASYHFASLEFTYGLISGGTLILISFYGLQKTIFNTLKVSLPTLSHSRLKSRLIIKNFIRLIIIGFCLYYLINSGFINIIGLLAGLSILLIAIFCTGIRLAVATTSKGAI